MKVFIRVLTEWHLLNRVYWTTMINDNFIHVRSYTFNYVFELDVHFFFIRSIFECCPTLVRTVRYVQYFVSIDLLDEWISLDRVCVSVCTRWNRRSPVNLYLFMSDKVTSRVLQIIHRHELVVVSHNNFVSIECKKILQWKTVDLLFPLYVWHDRAAISTWIFIVHRC
jgi:hypothetical protein